MEKVIAQKKSQGKAVVLVIILILLLAAASAAAVYFYRQFNLMKTNPNLIAQKETDTIKKDIASIMEVPNEEPSIATVIDKEKLGDQPFFQNAQNGDRVIIYTNAKEAILFRPSAKKIINVAPISFDADQKQGANSASAIEAQQ